MLKLELSCDHTVTLLGISKETESHCHMEACSPGSLLSSHSQDVGQQKGLWLKNEQRISMITMQPWERSRSCLGHNMHEPEAIMLELSQARKGKSCLILYEDHKKILS